MCKTMQKFGNLSTIRQLCYGCGAICEVGPFILNLYLTVFLLETALLRAVWVSFIMVAGCVSDAISDPLVGFIVSKFQRKKSSLRYWVLCSTPILTLSFIFHWYIPASLDSQEAALFLYFLTFNILIRLSYTIYNIPYSSLTMYQSTEPKVRDCLTALRSMVLQIFILLAMIGQKGCFELFGHTSLTSSASENESLNDSSAIENSSLLKDGRLSLVEIEADRKAYLYNGIWLGCVMLVAGLTCGFGSVERADIHVKQETSLKSGFFGSIFQALRHKPYAILMTCYGLISTSISVAGSNVALYSTHVVSQAENFVIFLIIVISCQGFTSFFWYMGSRRLGKLRVIRVCLFISTLGFGLLAFCPRDASFWVMVMSVVLIGVGFGGLFMIPWTMVPDTIDDFTVKTGYRSESIFYGFFVFFTKLATGLSLGLSNLILWCTGYVNNASQQSPQVIIALRCLCSAVPIFFMAIFVLVLSRYPLTTQDVHRNKLILLERIHAKDSQSTESHQENTGITSFN